MNKLQIILSVAGVLAVVLLYQLPKVVVEGEQASQEENVHDLSVSPMDGARIANLRSQMALASDNEKLVTFADSLAALYLNYRMADSAVWYGDMITEIDSSVAGKGKVASIYYRAFEMSEGERKDEYAVKARMMIEQLLASEPERNEWKNKLAMILVNSETPMKGVMMLREILESDPDNREAIMNLGVLAIRSGQYERALDRFRRLTELDSADHEAWFYLAIATMESGQEAEAKTIFEKILSFESVDPAIREMTLSYKKELENI